MSPARAGNSAHDPALAATTRWLIRVVNRKNLHGTPSTGDSDCTGISEWGWGLKPLEGRSPRGVNDQVSDAGTCASCLFGTVTWGMLENGQNG